MGEKIYKGRYQNRIDYYTLDEIKERSKVFFSPKKWEHPQESKDDEIYQGKEAIIPAGKVRKE